MSKIGQYLLLDGAITEAQCEAGLRQQRELDEAQEDHRLIGEILLEMEAIDVGQLQRALDHQWQDDLASESERPAR